MAANISVQNGIEELAYVGKVPWHGIGTEVTGLMTASEALTNAHLDWAVEKHPAYANINGVFVPIPDQYATIRMDSGKPLGVVGSRYVPVQNKNALNLLDSIVATGEAKYEVAGALGNGEKVWLLARLPESVAIAGEEHLPYILLANSHDGKSPLIVQMTAVRVVCQNTLAVALNEGRKQFRARHTPDITNKVEEARVILGLAHSYFNAMVQEAEKLVKVKPTESQLEEFFGKLYKIDAATVHELVGNTKNPVGNNERHVDNILALYHTGLGNYDTPVEGTAWALVQSVTDYLDHSIKLNNGSKQEARFEKSMFGQNADVKQRAWDMAIAMNN